jgi:hypothetical protein
MLEIAKQKKSYYICLREARSSGEPKRTSAVADSKYFSGNSEEKEENFKTLFKKLKTNAKGFQTASELLDAQNIVNSDGNRSFWNNLLLGANENKKRAPHVRQRRGDIKVTPEDKQRLAEARAAEIARRRADFNAIN